jgi:hypothetical protein
MSTFETLKEIYDKYRKKYKSNPDSGQMCCMWSTSNPPDVIFDSEQILTIEDKFDIELSEDDVMKLYDMDIYEAVRKIEDLKQGQC